MIWLVEIPSNTNPISHAKRSAVSVPASSQENVDRKHAFFFALLMKSLLRHCPCDYQHVGLELYQLIWMAIYNSFVVGRLSAPIDRCSECCGAAESKILADIAISKAFASRQRFLASIGQKNRSKFSPKRTKSGLRNSRASYFTHYRAWLILRNGE